MRRTIAVAHLGSCVALVPSLALVPRLAFGFGESGGLDGATSDRQPSRCEVGQLHAIARELIALAEQDECCEQRRQSFHGFTVVAEVSMRVPGVSAVRCSLSGAGGLIDTRLHVFDKRVEVSAATFVDTSKLNCTTQGRGQGQGQDQQSNEVCDGR
jgi:hypothetical protein